MAKVLGYAILVIFVAGMIWNNVSGFDGRIKSLEADDQNVKETLAALRQDVHDLHEWLRPEYR